MQKVLLVDDDIGVRNVLAEALMDGNYEATLVDTCHQARPLIATATADLLIVDVKLPDCDGTELADEADQIGLPYILMTGDFDVHIELTNTGRNCLLKPFPIDAFMRAVEMRIPGG